jgi:hypothetical protein
MDSSFWRQSRVALAPGADKVRVTRSTADVSACKAMGNIAVPRKPEGQVDMGNAESQFRNAAFVAYRRP